jgi:hypothetical protein
MPSPSSGSKSKSSTKSAWSRRQAEWTTQLSFSEQLHIMLDLRSSWKVPSSGIEWRVVRWKWRAVSEDDVASMLQSSGSACCLLHAGFLLALIFDLEDGDNMFPRNVGWLSRDYTALYPRKQLFIEDYCFMKYIYIYRMLHVILLHYLFSLLIIFMIPCQLQYLQN